jgi:K+-sensing histidine kinase KdpD
MPAWHSEGCGMKNEIVVGLDDSPSGKAVVDWAAEQAKTLGAVLRAVHVAAMTA